jgi:hypothetical protein
MYMLACLIPAWVGPFVAQDFDAPRLLSLTQHEWLAKLVDLDADGDQDALAFTLTALESLLGDGQGNFSAPVSVVTLGAQLQTTRPTPAVADFDGDGVIDVLLTNEVPASNDVALWWLRGLGDGTFAPPVQGPTTAVVMAAAIAIQWDSDPAPEAAWIRSAAGVARIEILEFNAGAFQLAASSAPLLDYPIALSAGDLDGDGRDELLALDPGLRRFTIHHNSASIPTWIAAFDVPQPVPSGKVDLALGEVDGAPGLDVVGIAVGPTQLSGPPLEAFVTLLTTVYANDGSGQLVQRAAQSQSLLDALGPIYGPDFELADLDADGSLDLVGVIDAWPNGGFGIGGAKLFLLRNSGTGAFDAAGDRPSPNPYRLSGIADLDGDGYPDLVTSRLVISNQGSFEKHVSTVELGYSSFDRVYDVEGDGDVDMVRLPSHVSLPWSAVYLANDAAGGFALEALAPDLTIGLADYFERLVDGDFDGDGRVDWIGEQWRDSGSPFITDTYLGLKHAADQHGTGCVLTGPAAPPALAFATPAPRALDVDGDGALDVADGGNYWRGDGTGSLSAPVELFADASLQDARDVDGDADQDLLTFGGGFAATELRLERAVPGGYAVTLLASGGKFQGVARFADLDEDGDLDVAATRYVQTAKPYPFHLAVFENQAGAFGPAQYLPFELGAYVHEIAFADADGDGRSDVLLLANDATQIQYTRAAVLRRVGPGLEYARWDGYLLAQGSGFGDADGDGDLDIVGTALTRGLGVVAPAGGSIRQYGLATAGAAGARPLLGATGPLAVGSPSASLRVTRGVGAAPGLYVIGTQPSSVSLLPGIDATLVVGGTLFLVPIHLQGVPGAPGQGRLAIPISVNSGLVCQSFFDQVFLLDTAVPGLVTATNGVEKHFAP